MAITNPWLRFKNILEPASHRYRGEVVEINPTSGIVKVTFTGGSERVSGGSNVTIGDEVLVVDGVITKVLPDLPYQRVEI